MEFNKYQSTPEELNLAMYPDEVQEQFWDFIQNVPYINRCVSANRPYAKDLPRDEKGRIIVDIVNPHILEDMDYFRPTALHYQKYGKFTNLRPNPNPNSEYGKWVREEVRRCYEGYVRKSDGEWVTGNMYFFLNYCPIPQTKTKKGSKKGERIIDFPEFWEGIYYRFHYLEQAQKGGLYSRDKGGSIGGDNGCEISSRSKSKSLTMAAILAKYYILGEAKDVNEEVKCLATAYQKQYLTSDGILNKFQAYIDFLAQNTEFPRRRLRNSLQDMSWKAGYIDLKTDTQKGTKNEVMGVSTKDDFSKVRGKRLHFIVCEEFGSYRNILELYNIMLPSVQEGDYSFGTIYLIGTAGDKESDFTGAQELVYNPDGYGMYGLPNDFDIEGQGRNRITFFFPGYINRKGCYDKDGNSDVTKAILEIIENRYRVKYNSQDLNTITKTIAEIPITPQEAILKVRNNYFPVTQLTERINQLDNDPNAFDDVYCGDLAMGTDGIVKFISTNNQPIRDFPTKDNTEKGCLEIYEMPQTDRNGNIPLNRYILSLDPYVNDQADSMSLGSAFVLDLFTDRIVAEYTGRTDYADDLYEKVRLMCMFYNGKCLYESNNKGPYGYFSKMNSTHLLADTPTYLRDKNLIKYTGFGNSSKGVSVTPAIINYGNILIKDWLTKPVTTIVKKDDQEVEMTLYNLYFIKNRALLKELLLYNPKINVDRVRSLLQLMLYREEKLILYGGNVEEGINNSYKQSGLEVDPFFVKNFDQKFNNF